LKDLGIEETQSHRCQRIARLPMLEAEAAERMRRGKKADPTEKVPGGEAREIAAAKLDVNPRWDISNTGTGNAYTPAPPRCWGWTRARSRGWWNISNANNGKAYTPRRMLPMLEAEAKERQRLSKGRGQKGREIIPDLIGKSTEIAAARLDVNPRWDISNTGTGNAYTPRRLAAGGGPGHGREVVGYKQYAYA
jgi:hypothetical protein